MSTNGHQIEQQYSTRNLSDSSETGSHFELHSGFYMTSFTATIFIASLITLGVLLVTMVISLAIMLRSCQSKNTGIIELQNTHDHLSYCKVYFLHAELNNLEGYKFPTICRDMVAIHYIKEGQYARDLDLTKSVIDDYFNSVRPSNDGFDVVLMDIDGIFPTNPDSSNLFHRFHNDSISNCIKEAKNVKLMFVLRLFMNLQTDGWSIILISRGLEIHQNVTIKHLISAGFSGWSSLVMRAGDEVSTEGNEYFSRKRKVIGRKGFHIKSIISSHMDALSIADTGMRIFLLPDPLCDKFEQEIKSIHPKH